VARYVDGHNSSGQEGRCCCERAAR
jgi:hypothetical protein